MLLEDAVHEWKITPTSLRGFLRDARGGFLDDGISLRACRVGKVLPISRMSSRRALIALFLLAATAGLYWFGRPGAPSPGEPSPVEKEAGERSKADPFPAAAGPEKPTSAR